MENTTTNHFNWKTNLPKLLAVALILFFIFRHFSSNKQVNYTLDKGNQLENVQGVESIETFKKNANVLLSIPQQIIRRNIVTFSVKSQTKAIDKVGVILRFKGNPKEIRMGIRSKEDEKYTYKPLYHALINPLHFTQTRPISFWQKKQTFKNVNDFAKSIPPTSLIGYYMIDPTQLTTYAHTAQKNINASTTITHTLRGSQVMYVKVTQGPLVIHIEKQDANQYSGDDIMDVTIEKNNQVIVHKKIADDGVITNSGLQLSMQSLDMTSPNTQTGVYKVTLKDMSQGSDIRVNKIVINQPYVIFASPLFIVDPNPTTLITDAKTLTMKTAHIDSFQTIRIDNNQDIVINKINTPLVTNLTSFTPNNKIPTTQNVHTLTFPKNDVYITADGYFAFSKNSYFSLNQSNFVDITKTQSLDTLDYIIANYQPVVKKGEWYEAFITFSSQDIIPASSMLYFSLESPDLNSFGGEIVVDKLEISITKP